MNIEMCIECDNPTGKAGACEDSLYVGDNGPFCEDCFEWKMIAAEREAVIGKLEAEIERFKAHTWEKERAAVITYLSNKSCGASVFSNDPDKARALSDAQYAIEQGEHWHG